MHLLLANNSAAGGGKAGAFESIASASGTGSSNTITFSSIPSTYQHLQLRIIAKGTLTAGAGRVGLIRFNSDTGSNYASHRLRGNGTDVFADGQTSATSIRTNNFVLDSFASYPNTFGVAIIDIHDYASTTKNKTVRTFTGTDDNGIGNQTIGLSSGLWMNTSAITSLTFINGDSSDNFVTASTFALYGIKAAA